MAMVSHSSDTASTTTSEQPFRLLDLPLELQRKILEHYFSTPWTVRSPCLSPISRRTGQEKHRFDVNLNVMLVSRRLRSEAIDAILRTRAGTYQNTNQTWSRSSRAVEFTVFDNAVTTVEIRCRPSADLFGYIECRFRNVRNICLTMRRCFMYDHGGALNYIHAVRQKTLLDVLERKHDKWICDHASATVRFRFPSGIPAHWTIRWTVDDYPRWYDESHYVARVDDRLVYRVRLTQAECIVEQMTYKRIEYEDKESKCMEQALEDIRGALRNG